MKRPALLLAALAFSAHAAAQPAGNSPSRTQVRALTAPGSFTSGIEGPACDRAGNVFAVNYRRQRTIGRVTADGRAQVWVTLPGRSTGNGIRFGRDRRMYVADYVRHNVLRIDPATRRVTVFAHEPRMNQPNDLASAPDGTLYASDPNWKQGTGQLWRIDRNGRVTRLAEKLGTTNGIEVSPDGKTLYVNESLQRRVWAYALTPQRTLGEKRLLITFPDHAMDGMRCDVDGNLYITRHGKGTVVVLSPAGNVLREIALPGTMPSNLCFGGPDGRTVYVTEQQKGRLLTFRADRPGLEWQRWRERR
jgi:sugar lactone lactonase YvrE